MVNLDTSDGLLKIRNAANNGYVTVGTAASTNLGLMPQAGGTFTGKITHNYTSSLTIPSVQRLREMVALLLVCLDITQR